MGCRLGVTVESSHWELVNVGLTGGFSLRPLWICAESYFCLTLFICEMRGLD